MKLLCARFLLLGCTFWHLLLWEAEVTDGKAKFSLSSVCVLRGYKSTYTRWHVG